jgi:hypothetical protein
MAYQLFFHYHVRSSVNSYIILCLARLPKFCSLPLVALPRILSTSKRYVSKTHNGTKNDENEILCLLKLMMSMHCPSH